MEFISKKLPAEVYLYKEPATEIQNISCSGHFILVFVKSGILRILVDGVSTLGASGEIIIAVSQEYYQVIRAGKKLFCYIVKINREFILETKMFYHFMETFIKKHPLKIVPDEFEQKVLSHIMKLLVYFSDIQDRISQLSAQSFSTTLSLLLFQTGWLYNHPNPSENITYSRKETLTMGFLKLLLKHFKNEQNIGFYSGVLCVTDGYLNKSVREVTGKTVGFCIAEILINEAKYLLAHHRDSIETISEQLGFSSTGSFGRFFKRHTLFAPSAFRKKFQV